MSAITGVSLNGNNLLLLLPLITTLLVADYETGGLQYNGETKNNIVDTMFTTTGHTSTNVPFYLYIGEDISLFNNNDIIDNTDVAKLLNKKIII